MSSVSYRREKELKSLKLKPIMPMNEHSPHVHISTLVNICSTTGIEKDIQDVPCFNVSIMGMTEGCSPVFGCSISLCLLISNVRAALKQNVPREKM